MQVIIPSWKDLMMYVENAQWTAKLEEYSPQALTTDRIEGLGQVHKENAQVLILLAERFLDLSYGEY